MREAKSGENNPNYGKPLRETHRKRIGEAQLGEKNHRFGKVGEKNHRFGIPHNEETRQKIREALIGRKHWVNEFGEGKLQVESPGPEWQKGRKWK